MTAPEHDHAGHQTAATSEMTRSLRRRWLRATRLIRHPRWLAWSIENRWKGYKFGPIKRCRKCDHTTPYHYEWCRK